ncbi:MAG: replication initiator protein A [Planctomycetes bacterium]|nr:replication initiator protein A [Planctomycetota bacterium]
MTLRQPPKYDAQLELFSALFTDIATRDARETMEAPFLSISKDPRFEPIRFKRHDVEIVVTGGKPYGIANIWDWDLMLWLLSQIREGLDRGIRPGRRIRFHRRQFLKDARRSSGGSQYKRLEESIARLGNTNVFTTLRPPEGKKTVKFSWIEYSELERDQNGHVTDVIVVLPEWLYGAVCDSKRVLTLDRDYFLLTGGLERELYRLIRKGAGRRPTGWKWKLKTLHEYSASTQQYKYFARSIRELVSKGRLLEYELRLQENRGETFLLARRKGPPQTLQRSTPKTIVEVAKSADSMPASLRLRTATFDSARQVAPGYDIHALAEDWKTATKRNGLEVRDPDAAFLAWCKKVNKRSPLGAK